MARKKKSEKKVNQVTNNSNEIKDVEVVVKDNESEKKDLSKDIEAISKNVEINLENIDIEPIQELPEPEYLKQHRLGDKNPAYLKWLKEHKPEKFNRKYKAYCEQYNVEI